MVKHGRENFYFEIVAATQCKKFCLERLNWPGRLAGISELVVQFENKKKSRPSIFKPKMVISRVKSLVHL